jgi:hypothetical protein
VYFDQLGKWEPAALCLQVEPLPTHHAFDTASLEQLTRHLTEGLPGQRQLLSRSREDACSYRNEQVAHECGRCDVKGAMGSGTAAAEIIIVHARQIVVDQGVGVHRLDRGRNSSYGVRLATSRPVRCQQQRGSNALARRPQRVAQSLALPAAHLSLEALGPTAEETIGSLPRFAQQISNGR